VRWVGRRIQRLPRRWSSVNQHLCDQRMTVGGKANISCKIPFKSNRHTMMHYLETLTSHICPQHVMRRQPPHCVWIAWKQQLGEGMPGTHDCCLCDVRLPLLLFQRINHRVHEMLPILDAKCSDRFLFQSEWLYCLLPN